MLGLPAWLVYSTGPGLWLALGISIARIFALAWRKFDHGDNPFIRKNDYGSIQGPANFLMTLAIVFWPITILVIIITAIAFVVYTAIVGIMALREASEMSKLLSSTFNWIADWDSTTDNPKVLQRRK